MAEDRKTEGYGQMTAASTQLSLCAHYANPEPDNATSRQEAWFSSLVNASVAAAVPNLASRETEAL